MADNNINKRPQRVISSNGRRSFAAAAIAGNRSIRTTDKDDGELTVITAKAAKAPPPAVDELVKARSRKIFLSSYQHTGKVIKQLNTMIYKDRNFNNAFF